eukprot:549311-Prymnesium_polylepis.2
MHEDLRKSEKDSTRWSTRSRLALCSVQHRVSTLAGMWGGRTRVHKAGYRTSIRLCALVPSLSVRVRPIRSFTRHGASNLLEPRHSWWLEPVNMLLTRMRWEVTRVTCFRLLIVITPLGDGDERQS